MLVLLLISKILLKLRVPLSRFYSQRVLVLVAVIIVVEIADIRKTRLYNFDPLKPHFCIVKLGFTGVYIIFLISAQKHRLWVLVRTASLRQF